MSVLELLLVLGLAWWLVIRSRGTVLGSRWLLPGLIGALVVLSLLVDGWRWPMIPTYSLAAIVVAIVAIPRPASDEQPRRWWQRTIGTVALVIAVVPPLLFPRVTFPRPTGSYLVGTAAFEWADPNRLEPLTPADSTDHRRIPVQLWYPATAGSRGTPVRYHPNPDVLAAESGGPPWLMTGLLTARTHALPNAAVAGTGRLPVVLFSHGWGGYRFQNTFLMEELASHGYVVASIEHTYMATGTVLSDGTRAPFIGMAGMTETAHLDSVAALWAADARFVLDRLDSLDRGDPTGRFRGRLDLAHVGYEGMSFGGASAVEAGETDARIAAVLDLDGPMNGGARARGAYPKPILLFRSPLPDTTTMDPKQLAAGGMTRGKVAQAQHDLEADEDTVLQHGGVKLDLVSSGHMNFTDLPLAAPTMLRLAHVVGPGNAARLHRIVNVYSLAFFDQCLRGRRSPLLDGPAAEYPEVRFSKRK